jgi:hypothetical protein
MSQVGHVTRDTQKMRCCSATKTSKALDERVHLVGAGLPKRGPRESQIQDGAEKAQEHIHLQPVLDEMDLSNLNCRWTERGLLPLVLQELAERWREPGS